MLLPAAFSQYCARLSKRIRVNSHMIRDMDKRRCNFQITKSQNVLDALISCIQSFFQSKKVGSNFHNTPVSGATLKEHLKRKDHSEVLKNYLKNTTDQNRLTRLALSFVDHNTYVNLDSVVEQFLKFSNPGIRFKMGKNIHLLDHSPTYLLLLNFCVFLVCFSMPISELQSIFMYPMLK